MPKLNVINVSGETVGEIELNESIFGIEVNGSVLHETVKNYLRTRDKVRIQQKLALK